MISPWLQEKRFERDGAEPMIAATALLIELVLVTGNQAHYQRIVGLGYELKLANWRVP